MLELKTKIRKVQGKKVKNLRQENILPAVVYGHGAKTLSLQLDTRDFKKIYQEAGGSTVIRLKIEGEEGEERNVLIHDVDKEPVTGEILHVDFYQIKKGEKVTAEVPLVFEGEAPAVKSEGGVLIKDISQVEVESLPEALPHEIKVDISSLEKIDDAIRIKDLKIPQGAKIKASDEDIVASIIPPRTTEELEALEEEVEEKVEEVEKVEEEKEEGEEKPEEEGKKEEEKEEQKEKEEEK